ncbi:uncharacterized protein PGTG_21783 [Puccinia graminis f. sp. tritici CRL 75-36-700-3]|uniref:Uncharacterized protein n=1 Tax=Puccinia graminis f. sp. tritici (strain CRL 75-36-700-3 / race SCCL) TaxID=418459 RepID=H6QSG7_PUCGT|nr:uncharacterized protein PGTG_21783 [Puccinia graminis f. sp. tritici CRL 75-36-700-3]EHS63704.1 hypothetical protein PGTG_21783 [Puccinia graminis f. sp. tritici CRL 75-36-700-3]
MASFPHNLRTTGTGKFPQWVPPLKRMQALLTGWDVRFQQNACELIPKSI